MNALFISNDNPPDSQVSEANTSYFRVLIPLDYLNKAGHTVTHQATPPKLRDGHWIDTLDWTQEFPETILVERMLNPERVRKLRLNGAKRIVMTFDDNYLLMPKYSSASKFWKSWLPGFLDSLPLVDEVIVPSEKLADDFRNRCRKISVVNNFHDGFLWERPRCQNDKLTIGWGGSEQHVQSWSNSGILPAIKLALAEHPDWQLVIYCPMLEGLFIGMGIPVTMRQWVPFENWPAEVMGFDIGLAPLAGDYDRRRSFLKPLEYGLAGVPFIASDDSPYAGKVQGGILAKRTADWEKALHRLMCDAELRRSLSEQGKAWASGYTMEKNISVYEKVLWPQ